MNPLDFIIEPLEWLLNFLHDELDLTYGWAIVVLTVIVRLVLLPLVIKQYQSMRQLQAYSPQIKEIQAKYKGNRTKQQEELMKFYRENQINPLASCLPIAAQLPIFIALYFTLRRFSDDDALDGTDPSFMWVIPDISQRITEIGWGAAVVLGVYGISQLLSTELSATPNMPDFQKRIFRIIPVAVIASFFMFDNFPLPAGLVLYWATTNLWTAGQQLVMRHRIGLHLSTPDGQAQGTDKKSSRTPPQEVAAAAVAEGAVSEESENGVTPDVDGADVPEAKDAPEATDAPEPQEAPAGVEPDVAEEAEPSGEEGAVAVEERPDDAGKTPAEDNGQAIGRTEDSASADGGGKGKGKQPSSGSPKGAGSRKRRPPAKGSKQTKSGKRRAPRRKR